LDYNVGGDFEHGLFGDLEDSRNGVLFQTIYGLPFQTLSFISRTTFLANEILALRYQDSNVCSTPEIERRCAELETEICSWSDEYNPVPDLDEDENAVSTLVNRTIMAHLIAAFHTAIIIFFYRRVRNLNALLLQPLAEKTLAHLQSFEQEQQRFSVCNCEIVWPAFIAGAEAMDSGLQDRFDHHLRDCASRSGMWNFETAADFLLNLWEARRREKNASMTWLELMTEKKVSLIFTQSTQALLLLGI
jgi:arginine metabolism regulation protein II